MEAARVNYRRGFDICVYGADVATMAPAARPGIGDLAPRYDASAQSTEKVAQARDLREIFGNPFRPVAVDPLCRTAPVLSLAAAAYDQRQLPDGTLDLARLAILADALEDAGCTERSILDHLRGAGPHVRGCWPVDLVLAKA
jgi:hypothetical protein